MVPLDQPTDGDSSQEAPPNSNNNSVVTAPAVENEAPVIEKKILSEDTKKQIASIMKVLKKTGLQHALGALELETGLSKDELKDLTNETDFTQVLNQYKSNADKDSFREAYQARV